MKSFIVGKEMARKPGNPEFGKKWKIDPLGDVPLTERIEVRTTKEIKDKLATIATQDDVSIPEVVRRAIAFYLANQKE